MLTNEKNIYYTLRIAAAMCFIGHGAFGIITKEIWCNYFGVFGIGHAMAYKLMPWLGSFDILCGLSLLIYPTWAIVGWLVIWGAITAFLRPMSGEPFAEFIERAGNFGAPLILLVLYNRNGDKVSWFAKIDPVKEYNGDNLGMAVKCLKVIVFLLIIGHGWLNLIEKKGLVGQYSSLGFSNPALTAQIVGVFEALLAITILIKPIRPVVLVLLVWKMGTELFYPHWELFEWIERGGSYGTILALWFALPRFSLNLKNKLITT
ncbi:hypothetical protein [Mucilaginibacter sp.]|uniref:hypothetical protein n=1 Tax=Mucilaginibacter sp. TaxID=1882438 RepID=UPI00284EA5F8|nr:hypothetical protein [Mucilaginibacter sp.]MDR3697605.1 hypothetical protein [Mucilaginibacter sp.]